MSAESGEALDVLRNVWRSSGQSAADLDDPSGEQKSCKRMADAGVGYEEFGTGEQDLRAAWRNRLEREGKLDRSGGTIRDLVIGSTETR
jgi:hypothetical protein